MATIMISGNSEGQRRCDARCHTATTPHCDCCCGGRYHGKGSSKAAQEQLTKDWLGDDWQELAAELQGQAKRDGQKLTRAGAAYLIFKERTEGREPRRLLLKGETQGTLF